MKKFVLLYLLINSSIIFGLENNPICINRSLSRDVHVDLESNQLNLKIKEDVHNLVIKNIYGLNGLEVGDFSIQVVKEDKEFVINLDLNRPSGRSYIVLNIEYVTSTTPPGVKNREVVSVPVGEMSERQLEDRYKNVKIYPKAPSNAQGNQAIDRSTEIMVHELPMKETRE